MSKRIVYSQAALRDLRESYEYIADTLFAPEAARALSEKIMAAVRSLEEMPERIPLYRQEPWRSQGVRCMTVKNHLVFFTVHHDTQTVFIVRVMYGGRDVSRQLKETDEL